MVNKVESFCARLNKALYIRNMKAVDVCRKTGIKEGAMSQYKSGRNEPKAENLQLIADALHVSPVWLMGVDVPMEVQKVKMSTPNAEALASLMDDDRFFEYVMKAKTLRAEKKEVLYSYIDFLISNPQ